MPASRRSRSTRASTGCRSRFAIGPDRRRCRPSILATAPQHRVVALERFIEHIAAGRATVEALSDVARRWKNGNPLEVWKEANPERTGRDAIESLAALR